MTSNQRGTRAPLISTSKLRIKCPVCDHRDNCAVSEDRRVAFCRRVASAKPGRGGWIHILTDDVPTIANVERVRVHASVERASIEQCDAIYCTMLRGGLLSLATARRARLHARGLSDSEIAQRGYCDTPTAAQGDELAAQFTEHELAGVPGFYRDGGRARMVKCQPGYFVPYRDERGRIQALQYRLDEPLHGKTKYLWLSAAKFGGASSGAPVHHAYHHLLADAAEVVVTEGALKADVIAYLTQQPVIGIAGVATFGPNFAAHLRAVAPALRTVIVAYDMDVLHKPEVQHALDALTAQLERARFRVRVRTWPARWKGLDDYLLAQLRAPEAHAA